MLALPAIEFGIGRGDASLPYPATMVGFAAGGVVRGGLPSVSGIILRVVGSALMLGLGYVVAATATSLWQFAFAQAVLIGALGSAATVAPVVADVSLWLRRRRRIPVAIVVVSRGW